MYSLIYFLILLLIIIAASCDDDETIITGGGGGQDTNMVNYNDLIIWGRVIPFDTSSSAVNLYRGVIVRDSSGVKDAVLVDVPTPPLDTNFYFRSGDLSVDVPGDRTRFKFVYLDLTQAQFDTVTVIPDTDTTLDSTDFTLDQTDIFTEPLVTHNVWGFYLAGKFADGTTSKRVFGMLYLDFADRDPAQPGRFRLRFDVKINKNGENRFAKNPVP